MNIVIIGAGLTAAHAAEGLREQGYDGEVTILGAEPHPPYERPPLSKGLLLGTAEPESVFAHDEQWYADQQIDLRLGAAATGIDLDRRRVDVGGSSVPYDRLLVATGATPRHLPAVDASGARVVHLRTLEDSAGLKAALTGEILIIGAGWIGLEVAAAAREAGAAVTVVETAPLPLHAVMGDELARVFADLHREHGVDLRLGTGVDAIDRGGATLSDGHRLSPDLVVVGIGAAPETGLAERAGLATENGVLVDAALRTSDPHVFAAGDVANHDHPRLGRVRVEHWDNAIHQGQHAAGSLLGGDDAYDRLPYFFTDQYDLGMEYVGHVGREGYDEVVVRGDSETRVMTALWITDGRVAAGMHLNDWDAIGPLRSLVGQPADDRVRDPDVALADLTG